MFDCCSNRFVWKVECVYATLLIILWTSYLVADYCLFCHLLLHYLVQMFSKLNLVLLLKLNVVLYVLLRSFTWFFLCLFLIFNEFYLVSMSHLHYFGIGDKLFLLGKKHLFEKWSILMSWWYIRTNFIETWCCDERFNLIQKFLYFHIPGEARIDLDCRFEIWLIGLSSKNDLKHCVKDHLWLFSDRLA